MVSNRFHNILLELISLREKKDIDAFFEKLYQSITEPISGIEFRKNIIPEFNNIISMMIYHFSNKEEYEKCAILKNIIYQNSIEKIS